LAADTTRRTTVGTTLGYICTKCEHAFESSDGKNRGFLVEVQSMTCGDCRDVANVVIRRSESVRGMVPAQFLERDGRCPECDGTHLTPWDSSKPCPRCGEPVVVDPEGAETLWD
jgi:hypothetical protein